LTWFTDEHVLSEVLAETTPQGVETTTHMSAGGAGRYTERGGDFVFTKATQIAQGHCLPLASGQ
jgi:hypothetical protein